MKSLFRVGLFICGIFWTHFIYAQSVLNKFEILGRNKAIDIPFEYENDFILLKLLLQKSFPLNFIFDTGAEHTLLLKKEYADVLGFKYDRRIRLIGADQQEEMYAMIARAIAFKMSPTVSYSQDILVLEKDFFQLDELTGLFVDGVLSGSFFRSYVTHINFKTNVLSFIPGSSFRINRKYTKIPIEINAGKIYAMAEVTINNKKIPVKLLVDTGAGLPLLLYSNNNPEFKAPEKSIPGKLGKGLGGFIEGHIGKITELRLETFKFPSIVTSFQTVDSLTQNLSSATLEKTTVPARDGILGNQLLNRFDIYIDYQKSAMYLSPIKDLKKEFRVDKSGLELIATGHDLKQIVVNSIVPGSPAADAGMQKGDVLKKIAGLSINLYTLEQAIATFSRKSGHSVNVQFYRDGKLFKTSIKLRDMI